ncbi:MAG: TetR family transcriptional regulator [Aeromicrobium sp.]
MGMRAQLSQERSRLRRDELLTAAIELFAEGGARAITHRAVAARAGLPPATTTYYFESIQELIREALGAHVHLWTRELAALADFDLTVDLDLDKASRFTAGVFASRGPDVAALELSIFLAAAREPELQDAARLAMAAFEEFATRLLAGAGIDEPDHLAAAVVALIMGTALRRQSGFYPEDTEARLLTAAIRDLVAARALGPEGVDRLLAELAGKSA